MQQHAKPIQLLSERRNHPAEERHWIYGPGTGDTSRNGKRVDSAGDAVITLVVFALAAAFGYFALVSFGAITP